jgi:XapX domain-containing protein
MFKLAAGLVVAVIIGIGCRWFGIPLPGPPAIMGAAMAVAMASGYTATDHLLTHNRDAHPSTVETVQTPQSSDSADPALRELAVNSPGVK